MKIPIIENEYYLCIKLDWICNVGNLLQEVSKACKECDLRNLEYVNKNADAYCVRKTKNGYDEPILVEIKTKGSEIKLREAINQIKGSYSRIVEGKPRKALIIVEEKIAKEPVVQALLSRAYLESGIKIEIVDDFDTVKELKDIIERLAG